ncbi:unnamed protein product [Fraxinus pennsylvanica]|uniref:Uncharacterized protein n=1 Tax=Fraxinus pennsylvanica TaxID=56036 RepID=A0AAD2A4J1_9LAMI|nr:unnamed protein product [Fraxinus pennsylvanica]
MGNCNFVFTASWRSFLLWEINFIVYFSFYMYFELGLPMPLLVKASLLLQNVVPVLCTDLEGNLSEDGNCYWRSYSTCSISCLECYRSSNHHSSWYGIGIGAVWSSSSCNVLERKVFRIISVSKYSPTGFWRKNHPLTCDWRCKARLFLK